MSYWAAWLRHPQTIWLRRVIFQVHLWTGLALGCYIVAICVSGSILVYRNELYSAFSPESGGPVPAGYRFTAWLLDFHDNLLAAETGRHVNGVGALLVLVLCATGAVIWWPGVRSWQRSVRLETRSSSTRLVWSLHSMLGFWSFGFILLWGVTGTYLAFSNAFSTFFDYVQPYDLEHPGERAVDRIQYWLAYLHFGRLGGRGIPGCGRGLCDSMTKATWAAAGLIPVAMFVTGALMWWSRVLRPALRVTAKRACEPSTQERLRL